jgi:hypothetical protein
MLINFHHSLSFDKDTHSLFCNWVKNTSKLGKSNCATLCFCPSYFNADKIDIASFGNLLPQVHWHIMARFETDSYFPEPMWEFHWVQLPLLLMYFHTSSCSSFISVFPYSNCLYIAK